MTTTPDLVQALRDLADVLERLDHRKPLPDLSMALAVLVPSTVGPEPERFAIVNRLNDALGVKAHLTAYGHYSALADTDGPYAYTSAAETFESMREAADAARTLRVVTS